MRVLLQRVKRAHVKVEDAVVGSINQGLLAFLGIHKNDTAEQAAKLVAKLVELRIFSDTHGKMNLSVRDIQGGVLLVSQFTLYANCNGGRRPDFLNSAPPATALPLYLQFVEDLKKEVCQVATGTFGAKMEVELVNDGPATFLLESDSIT